MPFQVIQHVVVNASICHRAEAETFDRTGLKIHWVQFSVMDGALLNAVFLRACRSLVKLQSTSNYHERALEYRGSCIRSINAAISREVPSPSASTIFSVLALALDAVS